VTIGKLMAQALLEHTDRAQAQRSTAPLKTPQAREVVARLESAGGDDPYVLLALAFYYWLRYALGAGKKAHRQRALECYVQIVDVAAPVIPEALRLAVVEAVDDPDRLARAGARLLADGNDIDDDDLFFAGQLLDRSVELADAAGRPSVEALANQAVANKLSFDRDGSVDDLWRAAQAIRRALALSPSDHPHRAHLLWTAFDVMIARQRLDPESVHHWKFEVVMAGQRLAEEPDPLDEAIAFGEAALPVTPDEYPNLGVMAHELAGACLERYERDGDSADAQRALAAAARAVDRAEDAVTRAQYEMRQAQVHHALYQQSGDEAHLTRAVTHCQNSVAATPRNDINWPLFVANYCISRYEWYTLHPDPAIVVELCELAEQASAAAPADPTARSTIRMVYALARRLRSDVYDRPDDLDAARELGRR
jgi:tetratricopeptide (TPR) repeat protein